MNMPQQESQDSQKDQSLENLVSSYLSKCINQRRENTGRFEKLFSCIAKFNPALSWLLKNRDQISESTSLEERFAHDTSSFYLALEHASAYQNSYDAGLCMGFLQPSVEINDSLSVSETFKEGVKDGQIYKLKVKRDGSRKYFKLGCLCLAGLTLTKAPEYYDQEKFEVMKKLSDILNATGAASILYGTCVMLKTRLFGNDSFISRKLIKDGPFRFHRNPFYAGLILGGSVCTANTLLQNIFSDLLSPTNATFALGAIASLTYSLHQRVLKDERVLEKTFGQEYREYKAKTPRYFPAFWKLWQKEK